MGSGYTAECVYFSCMFFPLCPVLNVLTSTNYVGDAIIGNREKCFCFERVRDGEIDRAELRNQRGVRDGGDREENAQALRDERRDRHFDRFPSHVPLFALFILRFLKVLLKKKAHF